MDDQKPAECPICPGIGIFFDYGLQGEPQYACDTCGAIWTYQEEDTDRSDPVIIS